MKKEILILGIICLFIGVGIQPAFAVEISNNSPSENIEDCNCQVNDDYDIVRVKSLLNRAERLLNRVEIFTKVIPILSKDNPEVLEYCEGLSEKINTFKEMNEEFNSEPLFLFRKLICDFLFNLEWEIFNFSNYLVSLMLKSAIMNLLLMPLLITVTILEFSVFFLWLILCIRTSA